MNTWRSSLQSRSRQGFSLAEVTIAVGIAALGLMSLLGLMPQGLEMARRTSEISAEVRIAERLAGDLQLEKWSNLTQYSGGSGVIRLYDDQGLDITDSTDKNFLSFVVQIKVFPDDIELPASTKANLVASANAPAKFLKRAVVKIATTTNQGFDFSDANKRSYRTFSSVLANTNL